MANGDLVGATEEVVRAGMYPYWDADLKRVTPSAFTSEAVSVSRLAILNFAEIVLIFNKDFNGRVDGDQQPLKVRVTGRATVVEIVMQAEQPMNDKKNSLPNVILTVVEDKIENDESCADNPAHALICGWERENPTVPRKISRGVANRLIDIFTWTPLQD